MYIVYQGEAALILPKVHILLYLAVTIQGVCSIIAFIALLPACLLLTSGCSGEVQCHMLTLLELGGGGGGGAGCI